MKRIILFVMCLILLLTGCGATGETEYSGATKSIEILLKDNKILTLQIPVEMEVATTDNHYYWEFTNGTTIYRITSQVTLGTYNAEQDIYLGNNTVSKNFEDCSVTIAFDSNVGNVLKPYLAQAAVTEKSATIPDYSRLESLPSYKEEEMILKGNCYMPPNTVDNPMNLDSEVYLDGASWLQSWILDAKEEDMKTSLLTLAVLNTSDVFLKSSYESEDVYYYATDATIVAAKRLSYNSWYIYYGSSDMLDYILTGLEKVNGG